ncbi:MAG: sulfatase-like hydrolase/transferase, partial [Candidatus Hermodarchaeota archaeon]
MTSNIETLPNIIFILADDMGYGDLSCYGSTKISTPNMDKIASQGVRFTDAHSSSAVCTPSRYSILTGRYCWRTKLKRGVFGGYSFPLIEPDRPTIATLMKKRGYRTAAIGKWHLGLQWPTKN